MSNPKIAGVVLASAVEARRRGSNDTSPLSVVLEHLVEAGYSPKEISTRFAEAFSDPPFTKDKP